jgi:UDP-N-acetylglucosamine--N-acetylmuramyl-(pentapeptide) pyrophosphoryl-undecaprenol N-acetylglucosamine transferase
MLASLKQIKNSNIQFIWQTGSYYKEHIAEELKKHGKPENLHVTDFIRSMDMAYMAADLVISRAGASSISELCLLGKPSILVPSPNVSEDHQTHNAMALVNKNAALIVKDAEAEEKLIPMAINTVKDMNLLRTLGKNAHDMAFRDSDIKIAEEILQLIKK